MRLACAAACLAMATFAGPAVASPAPVRLDREQGLRFNLSGSVLRVSLAPQANRRPRDARRELWGKRVRAVCSTTFSPHADERARVVDVQFWPRGQQALSFSFRREISERVRWCLLEAAPSADSGVDIAAVSFRVFIRVYAGGLRNRRIGQQLRRYLLRNAASTPWLRQVGAIVVDRGKIAVVTELKPNRAGKRIARQICLLIQGADVADFTPGHAVYGREDAVIRRCPARRE